LKSFRAKKCCGKQTSFDDDVRVARHVFVLSESARVNIYLKLIDDDYKLAAMQQLSERQSAL
jgi:hypothetical protein